jgi:putative endonuclease
MHYLYVLESKKDSRMYTGYTSDLKSRLEQHNSGKVISTQYRRPFKIIYYEACLTKEDALHREKYLKTTYGKRFLKNRLKHYFHDRDG